LTLPSALRRLHKTLSGASNNNRLSGNYGRPMGQGILFSSRGFFFMAAWPPCVADAEILLRSYGFYFFLAYSQRSQIGCLPYFHICGLSVNLECMSEMCSTRLAEIQDAKKDAIISHLHSIAQFFGRPFVKRFALCYRSVDLSVLSVCDVGVLWPNGWMD